VVWTVGDNPVYVVGRGWDGLPALGGDGFEGVGTDWEATAEDIFGCGVKLSSVKTVC